MKRPNHSIERTRHDMSYMYALKSAIEEFLGRQAWYDLKETTSAAIWRKYVIKLLDAIELSVETTVEIKDDAWIKDIRSNLAHGRDLAKIAKTPEDAIAALSGTILRQVFLQLGAEPFSRSRDTTPLQPVHWDFSGFRSVQYVQSDKQREDLFLSKQRKAIGFEAQLDLQSEYRESKTKQSYSEWCAKRAV
jgi:hypothetical protein